ncbi:MAG: RNA polymerase subunit sigma-54 [Oceanospirillaceae bacterium]|uniref:HPF/RaiA family ribosome-associated protein n=1 Tax=unclassified Thalassolituus TaxID=2624967 RepID=UPI000C09B55E|nr:MULTISPECIES: HPF/RaiA family ribosome-associated protein [unclassified Thalassolituus]MAK92621.1 RNA polymerase subunit sigma-54 [Thalassolituus sp.]MAX98104.1 RNA polymerase subunit sigma-54 [Oceanospirillaceae bacterium]MAX98534.1 RNA polymerase subunit sigma-54 [Oceanospirillaceae bacterium]MBL33414.1 RNA polymerase subunit sigma-54 [Oceanospirillaceae bacterium]MBS54326.1 RNA polymerase subunit sigma-54 [Oceanospirillaceae bacterium]|tara:strand:+ start:229 stop:585 length:357 start_codon:yes stop_codon:yes gene_type:complete
MKGLEISFRDISHSDAIEQHIRDKAGKLTSTFDEITGVRAVVAMPHNHSYKGKLAHVSLEIGLPGQTVAITRDNHDNPEHEDMYLAVTDAFDKALRKVRQIHNKRIDKSRRAGNSAVS